MDYSTKRDLLTGLQNAFDNTPKEVINIDASNYVSEKQSLNCDAMSIDLDTLRKTRNTIEEYIRTFSQSGDTSGTKAQATQHLLVAKRCVDFVISKKSSQRKIR